MVDNVKKGLCLFFIVLAGIFVVVPRLASALSDQADVASRQLILVFDPDNDRSPSISTVLTAVPGSKSKAPLEDNNAEKSHGSGAEDVADTLRNPIAVGRAISGSTTLKLGAKQLRRISPTRALLDRYVVLTYATEDQAIEAQISLLADPRVLSVQRRTRYYFSAVPSNAFFSQDPAHPFEGNYQWGMQSLNLPQAWDIERRHAYLAAIDSGIPCAQPGVPCSTTNRPDLLQNFRPQFSPPIGDALGHGSHVAGIISATPQYGPFGNGQTEFGVTGVCWSCSFTMFQFAGAADTVTSAVDHGMQVINMSYGDANKEPVVAGQPCYYATIECTAFAYARERDVVLVAAAGNEYMDQTQFPARSGDVIAIGGTQFSAGTHGSFWRAGYYMGCPPTGGAPGEECGSNYGPEQAVVAPAKDVISTFPFGMVYNDQAHCGDNWGPGSATDGYGDCTGTSMSAPHVTGIVGLLRSANPLLTRDQIKTLLITNTNPCSGLDSDKCGSGIPDAAKAVKAALGDGPTLNRLTPLFSFYSATAEDHFYTTVPQMALAALTPGNLLPQPGANPAIDYSSIGSPVLGYSFPCVTGPCPDTDAIASVFVSHINPLGGADLATLYRYSYACSTTCVSTNANHVSHVYATDLDEDWITAGFQLDGIEGYVYPVTTSSQPPGTAKLCRKFDAARHDYELFLGRGPGGTDCSAASDGYTGGNYSLVPSGTSDWIGWAFPNAQTAVPITLGGYMSGNWYDPNQAGQGFQLELATGNTMIAIWFTFAPDGSGQNWIYAQGKHDQTKNIARLPAVLLTGAKFPPNFKASDVASVPWGTLTFVFTDCNHGTASWASTVPGYDAGSLPITRLTQIQGTVCP